MHMHFRRPGNSAQDKVFDARQELSPRLLTRNHRPSQTGRHPRNDVDFFNVGGGMAAIAVVFIIYLLFYIIIFQKVDC